MKCISKLVWGLVVSGMLSASAMGVAAVPLRPPMPVVPPGYACVWIAPAYRTITAQTWVPGHTDLVPDWLETSPGHFEQIWREVTTAGHYETSTRQVLVSEGHWELVRISPPPIYIDPPIVVVPPVIVGNAGTVGVEGYSSGPGEDLSKFSSLREWPK